MTEPSPSETCRPARVGWSRRETGIFFFGVGLGYMGFPGFARLLDRIGWGDGLMSLVGLALLVGGLLMMRTLGGRRAAARSSSRQSMRSALPLGIRVGTSRGTRRVSGARAGRRLIDRGRPLPLGPGSVDHPQRCKPLPVRRVLPSRARSPGRRMCPGRSREAGRAAVERGVRWPRFRVGPPGLAWIRPARRFVLRPLLPPMSTAPLA
jgi:hypothetical protein